MATNPVRAWRRASPAAGTPAVAVDRHEDQEVGGAAEPGRAVAHRGLAAVPRSLHRGLALGPRGEVQPQHVVLESGSRLHERDRVRLGSGRGRMDLVSRQPALAHGQLVPRAGHGRHPRRPGEAADVRVARREVQRGDVGAEAGAIDRRAVREERSHAEQDQDVRVEPPIDGLAAHRYDAVESVLLVGAHRLAGVPPRREGQQQGAGQHAQGGRGSPERVDERCGGAARGGRRSLGPARLDWTHGSSVSRARRRPRRAPRLYSVARGTPMLLRCAGGRYTVRLRRDGGRAPSCAGTRRSDRSQR